MAKEKKVTEEKAVDFNDPAAINAELDAQAAAAEVTPEAKPKKPAKPRIIKVSHVAEKDYKAGDTIEFDYEVPKSASSRGMLVGIPVEEMTDDQLKIEYRNANSVFYKQTKAKGVATPAATERLEKVKAVMASKGIVPTARGSKEVDANDIAALIKAGKVSVDDIQALLDQAE